MNKACILVLSRYADLFKGFQENVDAMAPLTPKCLVRSGSEITAKSQGQWMVLQGPEPFVFSKSVNLGLKSSGKHDIILVGDDVRFLTQGFVEKFRNIAYSDPKIAVVVPKVEPKGGSIFICCYIRRDVITSVGPLDERFDKYGYDDVDFYTRYESMGYHTQPTDTVVVSHPTSGTSYFRRQDNEGAPNVMAECAEMQKKFEEKWGKK